MFTRNPNEELASKSEVASIRRDVARIHSSFICVTTKKFTGVHTLIVSREYLVLGNPCSLDWSSETSTNL